MGEPGVGGGLPRDVFRREFMGSMCKDAKLSCRGNRTYAPEGQTPVIHEKQTGDHLSVMGGMTPEGNVYTLARQDSLNGLHVIEFLTHLLRVAGERLLLIQ